MGNEQSHGGIGAAGRVKHAEELKLLAAIQAGGVAQIDAMLNADASLVYAHSKDGGIWHFAAQAGHVEVGAHSFTV